METQVVDVSAVSEEQVPAKASGEDSGVDVKTPSVYGTDSEGTVELIVNQSSSTEYIPYEDIDESNSDSFQDGASSDSTVDAAGMDPYLSFCLRS